MLAADSMPGVPESQSDIPVRYCARPGVSGSGVTVEVSSV